MTFLQIELPVIPSGVWKEVYMWLKSFPCTKKSALVAFFARKIGPVGPFCLHAKSESNSPVIQCIAMHIAFLCEHLQSFQQCAVSFVVEFSVITKRALVGGGPIEMDWDRFEFQYFLARCLRETCASNRLRLIWICFLLINIYVKSRHVYSHV